MIRCSYILPSERPCRSLALRNRSLCRHHTAPALEERAQRALRATPPPPDFDSPPLPNEYKSFWRGYHGAIRNSDESQFDEILADLMDALDKGVISDRSAGRLLHTLVLRRRQLHQEHFDQQLLHLGQQHAALRKTGISGKGLYEMLAPQARELLRLNSQKPTC